MDSAPDRKRTETELAEHSLRPFRVDLVRLKTVETLKQNVSVIEISGGSVQAIS